MPIERDGADQQRDRIEATPEQRIRYQIVTVLILIVCAVWYYKANIRRQITGLAGASDFSEYYRAARDVLSGRSPYENPAWFYPPITAFLIAPFALTDYLTARWIWFVLSHLFFLAAGWLLWRLGGRGYVTACCVAGVWAFGGAAGEMFMNGQISAVLVLLLVVAYTRESGFAVGLGFAVKYIPGVLAVALFFKRNWRALVAFAWVTVIGVVVPWLVLWFGFGGANAPGKARYWMGTPATYNWSIPAIVLRVLDPPRGGQVPYNWRFGNVAAEMHPLPGYQAWLSVGTSAAVLLGGVLLLRGRVKGPWPMIALMSLSLASAPVCWFHYQVLQYPGLALLLADSVRRRAWALATFVVICGALLYQVPVAALIDSSAVYVWTSVTPVACLGLFGLATVRSARS